MRWLLRALLSLLVLTAACRVTPAPYHCVVVTDSVVTPPPDTVAVLDCGAP